MNDKPEQSELSDETVVVSRTAETIEEATIVTSGVSELEEATIVTSDPVGIDEATVTTGKPYLEEATTVTTSGDVVEEATISGVSEGTYRTEVPYETESNEPVQYEAPQVSTPEPQVNGWGETVYVSESAATEEPIVEETPIPEGSLTPRIEPPVIAPQRPSVRYEDELEEIIEPFEQVQEDPSDASALYEKNLARAKRNNVWVLGALLACFIAIGSTIAILWSKFN